MSLNGPSGVDKVSARSLKRLMPDSVSDVSTHSRAMLAGSASNATGPCGPCDSMRNWTMRSGSWYGRGCSKTAWMTENIAVGAPMPSAIVAITTMANAGRRSHSRSASLASSHASEAKAASIGREYDESLRRCHEKLRHSTCPRRVRVGRTTGATAISAGAASKRRGASGIQMTAVLARIGRVASIVALSAVAPWAGAVGSDNIATSSPRRAPAAGPSIGVVWMVFVDDLHADFVNTGRLRSLLKSIGTKLIQEGDSYGMRSSGPSHVSVDITSDRIRFDSAIKSVIGNALKTADMLEILRSAGPVNEILSRSSIALDAARQSLESLIDHQNTEGLPLPKALIYISNGYYFDAMPSVAVTSMPPSPFGPASDVSVATLSHVRSELATVAARAGIRIVVIDPRAAMLDLDLDPDLSRRYWTATQESLRPLWEQTNGFALLKQEDLFTALTRISTAVRR